MTPEPLRGLVRETRGGWIVGGELFTYDGLVALLADVTEVLSERPAPFKDESIGSSGGDSRMSNLGRATRARREREAAEKAARKRARAKK